MRITACLERGQHDHPFPIFPSGSGLSLASKGYGNLLPASAQPHIELGALLKNHITTQNIW